MFGLLMLFPFQLHTRTKIILKNPNYHLFLLSHHFHWVKLTFLPKYYYGKTGINSDTIVYHQKQALLIFILLQSMDPGPFEHERTKRCQHHRFSQSKAPHLVFMKTSFTYLYSPICKHCSREASAYHCHLQILH